jgi:transposase
MGLDAHRKFSNLTGRDADGRIVCRQRVEHRDRRILREDLALWPEGTPVVLEATFGWGWLCDELKSVGLDPHLASSRKVAGWRNVRGIAKSNRTDADLLSELWSEKSPWWEVWLAPQEVRDQREWMRYRMSLVQMQTRLKNQIHAIMHGHGIVHEFSDLFGRDGRRLLNSLLPADDRRLRGSAKGKLKGYLQLLDHVRRQIAGATQEIRRQHTKEPDAERVRTIPGIKWILCYTILAEIGSIDRFKTGKHLASYALLAPRAYDSGEQDDESPKGRHVGWIGRRTLKWAFIEAAHGAVRKGGRFREIFDRHTDGGKKNKNRGYIVVGHELARVVYAMLKKKVDYMETPPDRPGSASKRKKRVRRKSRPGMGQPDHPLVVAV